MCWFIWRGEGRGVERQTSSVKRHACGPGNAEHQLGFYCKTRRQTLCAGNSWLSGYWIHGVI